MEEKIVVTLGDTCQKHFLLFSSQDTTEDFRDEMGRSGNPPKIPLLPGLCWMHFFLRSFFQLNLWRKDLMARETSYDQMIGKKQLFSTGYYGGRRARISTLECAFSTTTFGPTARPRVLQLTHLFILPLCSSHIFHQTVPGFTLTSHTASLRDEDNSPRWIGVHCPLSDTCAFLFYS